MRFLYIRKLTLVAICVSTLRTSMIICLGRRTARQYNNIGINVFDINIGDIFDSRLGPAQLMADIANNENSSEWHTVVDLNIDSALNIMNFHRRMMNEFLASNYLAKQILFEMGDNQSVFIEKRIGIMHNQIFMNEDLENNHTKIETVPNLLYDDGSKQYKAWLERTTILDDIQHQLKQRESKQGQAMHSLNKSPNRRELIHPDSSVTALSDENNFEDGDITGYALTDNSDITEDSINYNFQTNSNAFDYWPVGKVTTDFLVKPSHMFAFNKNGFKRGYENYGFHSTVSAKELPKHIREIGIKDIIDIALTTLAFLAFGMFILQILMCITMNKDDSNNMMMMPMSTVEANEIPADDTEEIRRKKRSTLFGNRRLKMMNNLSKQILVSIDALISTTTDKNNTYPHYKSLCEIIRYSRFRSNGQRIWIPIWSLGISWLSSKLNTPKEGSNEYTIILRSLKAIALGLADQQCNRIY